MVDQWPWWLHGTKREYNPGEVSDLILSIYDHATATGHILRDAEPHPVNAAVRLYRCSGCMGVYRLCLPGPSSEVWDEPSVTLLKGICPESYQAVCEFAWGDDGGLVDWGIVEYPWSALGGIPDHLSELMHGELTLREPRPSRGQRSLLIHPYQATLAVCAECGRLVAKLTPVSNTASRCLVSHIVCNGSGRNRRLRK